MTMIKALMREYFQKSRVFLFPALSINKENQPKRTYLSWPDKGISMDDYKLVCLYHMDDSEDYRRLASNRLVAHAMFEKLYQVIEEATGDKYDVFVYNMTRLSKDWNRVLNGKYSTLSNELKKRIVEHYKPYTSSFVRVHSFLYPEKNNYYQDYARLYNVDIGVMVDAVEVTDPPHMERETLNIKFIDYVKGKEEHDNLHL